MGDDGPSRLLSRRRLAAVPASLAAFGLIGQKGEAAGNAGGTPAVGIAVDVRQYGAKADGVTNDAPAFNAAIESIRERQTQAGVEDIKIGPTLKIPSGVYAVSDSINLTQLRDINLLIDGDGSVILGKCAGEPVIDALGSRWLTIRDLTIIGDKTQTPRLGVQIGRLSAYVVADDHLFEDVKIIGYYSLACLLNLSAETTGFDHVLLWNDRSDPQSHCLIQDGVNHFDTRSKFVSGEAENGEQPNSFNENEFINCDFRHAGGGIPVWLGDTARHRFIRCYAVGIGEAAFVVYCGQNSHTMLDIDCHCEAKGLKAAFLFTGTRTTPVIYGFSYTDHSCWASTAVFRADNHISKVALQDADIDIGYFPFYSSCKVFDDPAKWFVVGRYASRTDRQWNGGGCFNGEMRIGDSFGFAGDTGLKVAAGSVVKRPNNLEQFDAGRLFFDTGLGKLIVWSGTAWVDMVGNRV
jgi:hypothetical protein